MLLATYISWYLLPLAVVISLVYNTSRFEHPPRILRRAVKTFATIIVCMAAILLLLMALSYNL
jgi:hypothetical protein